MAYTTRKKPENLRKKWDGLPPNYETDMSVKEIQIGGSKKYGNEGGKWITDTIYQSIGGYRSRGGMPLKLRTSNKDIPISTTDAEELLNAGLIKSIWEI